MTIPHRDDVPARTARGPDDHDHSPTKKSGSDVSNLAIVESVIDHRHGHAGKHPVGVHSEIDASMRKGP